MNSRGLESHADSRLTTTVTEGCGSRVSPARNASYL